MGISLSFLTRIWKVITNYIQTKMNKTLLATFAIALAFAASCDARTFYQDTPYPCIPTTTITAAPPPETTEPQTTSKTTEAEETKSTTEEPEDTTSTTEEPEQTTSTTEEPEDTTSTTEEGPGGRMGETTQTLPFCPEEPEQTTQATDGAPSLKGMSNILVLVLVSVSAILM